ncbi:MAG: putative metallopeptidase [Actinomycetota bacterium]|nr:putative metallopeptidase [Actinomycetota bacterium]
MLYMHAPEVAEIIRDLTAQGEPHHELSDAGIRIEALFMDNIPMSHGRLVYGRARKVSGQTAWWAQYGSHPARAERFDPATPFGVVEIAHPIWSSLSEHKRIALVDHELCHFRVDWEAEPPALMIRGHDFEEFAQVIRRRGLWNASAVNVANAMAEELAVAIESIESEINPAPSDGET